LFSCTFVILSMQFFIVFFKQVIKLATTDAYYVRKLISPTKHTSP
jgi:hypothetical protein